MGTKLRRKFLPEVRWLLLLMPNRLCSTPVVFLWKRVTQNPQIILSRLRDGVPIPPPCNNIGLCVTRGDNIGVRWDICVSRWARTYWVSKVKSHGLFPEPIPVITLHVMK